MRVDWLWVCLFVSMSLSNACKKRGEENIGDGRAIWAIYFHDIWSSSINLTVFQRVQLTHRRWTPCIFCDTLRLQSAHGFSHSTFKEQSFGPRTLHQGTFSQCLCVRYIFYTKYLDFALSLLFNCRVFEWLTKHIGHLRSATWRQSSRFEPRSTVRRRHIDEGSARFFSRVFSVCGFVCVSNFFSCFLIASKASTRFC